MEFLSPVFEQIDLTTQLELKLNLILKKKLYLYMSADLRKGSLRHSSNCYIIDI